jgi:2C-methyl-D-erythritol 2,4-cyclodiphosphate synthase
MGDELRDSVYEFVGTIEVGEVGHAFVKEFYRLQFQIKELEYRAELAEKTVAERDVKIVNLHAIITKQTERIKRQSERITELEALYAGTKRAKKAKVIKAKYRALKAYCEARDVR